MDVGKIRKKQKSRLVLLFNDMIMVCTDQQSNNSSNRKDQKPYKYKSHFVIEHDNKKSKIRFSFGKLTPPQSQSHSNLSGTFSHSRRGLGLMHRNQSDTSSDVEMPGEPNNTNRTNQGFWFGDGNNTRHIYCSESLLIFCISFHYSPNL